MTDVITNVKPVITASNGVITNPRRGATGLGS
jgi:hypothetical protein